VLLAQFNRFTYVSLVLIGGGHVDHRGASSDC
jgi:hypothetical protein